MIRRCSLVAGLLFVVVLLCGHVTAVSKAPEEQEAVAGEHRGNDGFISATVDYKDVMVIAVSADGVAAIKFGDRVEEGVKYQFRYLKNSEAEEISGDGTVLQTPGEIEGQRNGGIIKAGPIRLGWFVRDRDRGYVFYKPEVMRLQIASPARFSGSDGFLGVDKLDLKRFLNQPQLR